MWFQLASSSSESEFAKIIQEDAVANRDRVAAEMTAEQIAEAERLAREWPTALETCGEDDKPSDCIVCRARKSILQI
jgi:hypothetical protein